jgi:hypothetical protein
MFDEGNIIYFTPFYFKNGNPSKHKYFVVLKNQENKSILASLPTRTDSIPEHEVITNGCIEIPLININCFVFSPNSPITQCGKQFDFKTHIYGYQLDEYDVDHLLELYQIENTDYEIWGIMKPELFSDLLDCLKNSKAVKRKYKKILER